MLFDVRIAYAGNHVVGYISLDVYSRYYIRGTTWLDDDGYFVLVVIGFFNCPMNALPKIFIVCRVGVIFLGDNLQISSIYLGTEQ